MGTDLIVSDKKRKVINVEATTNNATTMAKNTTNLSADVPHTTQNVETFLLAKPDSQGC